MAVDVERLIVRIEATQTKLEKEMKKATGTVERQARRIEGRFAQMNRRLGQSFAGLGRSLVGAFAAGFTARELKELSDAATRIDNSLKVAGLSGAELEKVYGQLRDSAIANAAPLEALVKLYGSAALAQKELNVTQQEMVNFSNNVAVALRVSGKSAEESKGALIQLSQAIGAGIVRAEEFNAILEGALPIAQAAAAGLEEAGGSVANLRRLIIDGKVSSEAFFRAFEAGAYTLREKVAGAQFTVSQALGNLQTSLIDTAREFNRSTGASNRFAQGINSAAEAISDFDVSSFINKISQAHGALTTFLNDLGNAQAFKSLNEALGITDSEGNMINLDAEAAKQEAAALEREVELLQARIAENTELGFDNTEALSRLDEVMGRLAQVRAEIANMPDTMLDPIAVRIDTAERDDAIMASEDARRKALGAGKKPERVSLKSYSVPDTGSGKKGSRGDTRENEYQREIAQIKERTASIEAMTAAQAAINPLVEDYGYAVERAASIIELENAAKKAGLEITPQLRAQIEGLAGAYATASAEAERLAESQEKAREQVEDMRALGKDVLSGFISDMRNGVSATEALANALTKVADKLLEMALNNLFGALGGGLGGGGGLLGGAIIPGILHSGGVAGRDGYGHGRAVSPSVFTGAKRYHKGGVAGLQPGEIPAILQKGEVVLPRGAAMQGGSAYAPTYNIDASGSDNPEQTRSIVMQALKEYDKGNYQRFLANMGNARKRNAI